MSLQNKEVSMGSIENIQIVIDVLYKYLKVDQTHEVDKGSGWIQ